jgi:hypothetical protein
MISIEEGGHNNKSKLIMDFDNSVFVPYKINKVCEITLYTSRSYIIETVKIVILANITLPTIQSMITLTLLEDRLCIRRF